MQALAHLGDLLGLVADALQVGDHLDDRHHQTQVTRRGLALGDHLGAGFVELQLHRVDALVVVDHLLEFVQVAVAETVQGAGDLERNNFV